MKEHLNQLTIEQQAEVERQFLIYSQGTSDMIPDFELKNKIAKSVLLNQPLKIKLGLDPSAPDVHLGHSVVLNKLRQFQENGHIIQLLIGDFTGKIGDPTGKSVARKQLTDEEVQHNARTYFEQFGKILDMDKVELYYNSKWLAKLDLEDVIDLAAKITVARLMERDDFDERLALGKPIALHEFFYPLMQGYDSVVLESDIELGGNDQYFNVLMGRHIQEQYGVEKQVVILMPLLEGLDGVEKMSKSKRNYIGLDEEPNQMYGKSMSVPDELMMKYFRLATDLNKEELDGMEEQLNKEQLHPRDAKMKLAHTIVRMYHGLEAANQAEDHFKTVFQLGALPVDMPVIPWGGKEEIAIVDLLMELSLQSSKSEARRMIQNGGIRLDGDKVEDVQLMVQVSDGMIVQVGRRKFVKIEKVR